MARRIADEQAWTLGREVGWHVRFERQFSAGTRVLLATEGILTNRLQQDPLLTGFRTIVLDEFHEIGPATRSRCKPGGSNSRMWR